jgi:pimeloyl-ACP methyl ester carboxylesterase
VVDYERNFGPRSPVPFTGQMREAKSEDDPPWSEMPLADTGYHLPVELVAEMAGDRTPESLRALSIPVLAYYGGRDKLVDVEPVRQSAAERSNIELRIARGAGHGFLLWRPWVVRRTVAWAARAARAADR